MFVPNETSEDQLNPEVEVNQFQESTESQPEVKQKKYFIVIGVISLVVVIILAAFWIRSNIFTQLNIQKVAISPEPTTTAPIPTSTTRDYSWPAPSPFAIDTIFQVGDFTYTIPAGTGYEAYYGKPVAVEQSVFSEIDTGYFTASDCINISNIYSMYYHQVTAAKEAESSDAISLVTWKTPEISFKNKKAEQEYQQLETNLLTLFTKPDGELNLKTPHSFNIPSLNYCGGGWFIPVYKYTVPTTMFDQVVYVEVNAGNGDTFQPPHKYLVINHKKQWLLISEHPGYETHPEMKSALSQCLKKNIDEESTLEEGVSCAAEVWKVHRTEQSVLEWSNNLLTRLEF